jgi:hypothetical protein
VESKKTCGEGAQNKFKDCTIRDYFCTPSPSLREDTAYRGPSDSFLRQLWLMEGESEELCVGKNSAAHSWLSCDGMVRSALDARGLS